jgi:uncharacterized repeat protein (TIGR03803 family)
MRPVISGSVVPSAASLSRSYRRLAAATSCCWRTAGFAKSVARCERRMGRFNLWTRLYGVLLLFAMVATPLGAQTLNTLHSFVGTDGSLPFDVLVQGSDGNLYGTTRDGGAHSSGAVFKITPDGALTTLYSFCSQSLPSACADGAQPYAGLVQGTDGNFYGTTMGGGNYNVGTVFKITPDGALTTLHNFCSQSGCGTDGYGPIAGLIQATDGNFYGTTYTGGGTNNGGTIFKITPSGAFTALYNFCSQANCADGATSEAGLVQGTDGNLYGTTRFGGIGFTIGGTGGGTVFKITLDGALTTLYSFCPQSGCTDGSQPTGALVQGTDGNFYGTTWAGGANPPPPTTTNTPGTIFKITPDGTLTTLHSFCSQSNCTDGFEPGYGALVQVSDGSFYGTTDFGGPYDGGTVFQITPAGALTVIYSFCSQSGCTDGADSQTGLLLGTDGNFYGTTVGGGANNLGTVFKLSGLQVGPALQSITVSPVAADINVGQTQAYTATGHYSDRSTKDLTAQVTWASSQTSVATISSGGLATAKGAGVSTISATLGTITGSATLTVGPVLQSITVSPATANLNAGQTQAYTATGHYSDQSTKDLTTQVTWASSQTAVATISIRGLATAVGAGVTTISATLGTITGSATLTVVPALQSITVSPATASLNVGQTQAYTAIGHYSDQSTKDLTTQVTWVSSQTSVATISSGGLATAMGAGVSTISATLGTVTGSATLTVVPVLQSITVSPATASVNVGQTQAYTATGHYSDQSTKDLTAQVTWASSKTSVATISSGGLATAVGTGVSTISATLGTITGSATLTVGPVLQTITVSPNTAGINVGQTQAYTATGHYADQSTKDLTAQVTWASSNTSVATIASGGVATGVTIGLSQISASLGAITGYATLTVTPPMPTFSPLPGTYNSPQSVAMQDAVTGAVIYYNTEPGVIVDQFSNKYTTPITVSQTTTINAAALVNGVWSKVATVVYTITSSTVTVTLSPTSLTFATQVTGTISAAKSVTVKNTGTGALTITGIAITGTNLSDFSQTTTCGNSLAAGASCTISVKFAPTASGTRTAAVSVTDNASGSPQKVTLTGIGTNAKLSPASLSFGTVAMGTTSAAKTVTLTNVGSTTLTIAGVAITGTNPGDFSETTTCGASLAAGASCTFKLTFRPTASGTRTAALSITDSSGGSPQVSLSGIGTTVKLSPISLNFGAVAIGTTSGAKTVTLTNVDTATLTITGIAITGTYSGDYAQTTTCGSSLAAGASCSFSITFKPAATGTRTAALSITDNAAGSPQKVTLSGIGTTAKLSPTGLSFGSVTVGATSAPQTVTLTNVGAATLTITGIAITGASASNFAQTNACGSSLAAGASCSISIAFKPTAVGTHTAALSVTDNAPGSPQKITLSGTGT